MRRAALIAAALTLGCQTVPPGMEPLAVDSPRVAEALQLHTERVASRQGLRARARIRVDGRGAPARQILLAERPARLRLEVLGLLGQRVMVLATDGEVFDLYRAEVGVVERGDVTPDLLASVTGIPVAPELAVALLLAVPPLPEGVPHRAAASTDGAMLLSWPEAELTFDAEGQLRAFRIGRGDATLHVLYDEAQEAEGGRLPHHIAIELGEDRGQVDVTLSDVELNPELPSSLFRLPAPRSDAHPTGPAIRVSSAAGGIRGMALTPRRAAR